MLFPPRKLENAPSPHKPENVPSPAHARGWSLSAQARECSLPRASPRMLSLRESPRMLSLRASPGKLSLSPQGSNFSVRNLGVVTTGFEAAVRIEHTRILQTVHVVQVLEQRAKVVPRDQITQGWRRWEVVQKRSNERTKPLSDLAL